MTDMTVEQHRAEKRKAIEGRGKKVWQRKTKKPVASIPKGKKKK